MIKLVLVRHGQSEWNLENRFTGWTDVELSPKGIQEAKEAGIALKNKGYHFDLAYSSVLKRAEDTLDFILKEMGEENIPIKRSWKLNERHYGALQGLNKDETRKKYGDEQVLLWRRSTDVRPPELDENDERYPGNDPKYTDLTKDELPKTENLIDTIKRVTEYWKSDIEPDIKNGKNVIIVAHGNSLRGLMKYLDNISDEDVIKFWNKNEKKIKPWYNEVRQDDDIIVSGSTDFLLDEIMKRMGIKNYVGSSIDKKTGKFKRLCFLENKVKIFNELYPNAHIDNFYTDSMNDKAMMDIADHVYLVNGNKIEQIK